MTAIAIDLYTGWWTADTDTENNLLEPGVRAGRHPEGLFAFAAASVEDLPRVRFDGFPEVTATGVVCRDCSSGWGRERQQVRHASVAHVRACADAQAYAEAEHRAELYAESAWLRYAEGGWDRTGEYAADLYR